MSVPVFPKMALLIISVSLAGLSLDPVRAQSPAAGKQVEQVFQSDGGVEVPYLLYLPDNYAPGKEKLPLVLFLHGRGESNGPLKIVAAWGPPQMAARGDKLPFIVVSPQCPKEDSWSSPTQQARLLQLLDAMIAKYNADTDHIYLTGLSMGGSGSWRMAADNPKRFAAVVPICGRGEPNDAAKLSRLPIWVFVGDQDRVFENNSQMVEALRKAGSQSVRLTTLENIGHNSWSAAYASPDLYDWMKKQALVKEQK